MRRHDVVRVLTAAAAVALLAVPARVVKAQEISGSWESSVWQSERSGESRIQLSLKVGAGDQWNHGFSPDSGELEGVTAGQLEGDADGIEFRLVREAGTLSFRGDVRDGRGVGFFSFAPSQSYRAAMARLGYPDLEPREQLSHALLEITTGFVTELRELGYSELPGEELKRFAIHGVRPEFIRAMNDLGYASIPAEDLVRMRIHGVTPDWVRRVRAALSSS